MTVFLKFETEARCEGCGKIGPIELSRLLCCLCLSYWWEFCKWRAQLGWKKRERSAVTPEEFWSATSVTLYDSLCPR
ncbi:MAG TPA: hypothetical protein VGR34_06420 [Candidatus Dormibacteraeota bacterium]|nr:hypothetical protein [Candidatus Dormibacteraeota bacterium]